MKIYNGYDRLPRNYTLLTDEYEYTMAYGYLRAGKNRQEAVFDVFFRKVPNGGGYAIMAGVDQIIPFIQNLKYNKKTIGYFERNNYPKDFIDHLKTFKFTGDIYAVPDGTPVFPNEPILTVKGPLEEVQTVETAILAILNGAMSHATAARRIVESTPKGKDIYITKDARETKNQRRLTKAEIRKILATEKELGKLIPIAEFGGRRADGMEAAIDASLYAIMVGCKATSNVLAADMINQKATGTMAHSWVEAFPTQLEAFICFANIFPNNCILLVDTYDTLKSGIPDAIKTFEYMKEKGMDLSHIGIRIDSGDLAYLSKAARAMLDAAGFPQATICLSNGLKAETIESLVQQGAVFNSLGVGDNISKPEGNMGCVYKEVGLNENGLWTPKIKLSNDTIKIINPDYKNLYRAFDKHTGYALADIMTRKDEKMPKNNLLIVSPTDPLKRTVITDYELVELQQPIFLNGELVYEDKDIMDIQKYCNEQMNTLYPEIKRTLNPHEYYVDGTENYVNFRTDLIQKTKKLYRKVG